MIYTGPPSNTRRVDVSKLKIEEAKDYMAEHNFSIDSRDCTCTVYH